MAIEFWRAAFVLVRSGMRHRVAESLLLALLAAFAAASLFWAAHVGSPSAASFHAFHASEDAPHVWFYVESPQPAQLAALKASLRDLPQVEMVTPLGAAGFLRLEAAGTVQVQAMEVPVNGAPSAAQPVVGRWPAAGAAEVVVDYEAARTLGIHVGDTVVLVGPQGRGEVVVTGLAFTLLSCPYPVCRPAFVWLPEGLLATSAGGVGGELVGLRLSDPGAAAEVLARGNTLLAATGLIGRGDTWESARGYYDTVRSAVAAFLVTLSGVALASVALLMSGSVGTYVHSERREAAVLRAIGLTPRQVRTVYALWGALVTVVGASLGWAVTFFAWREIPFQVFVSLGLSPVPTGGGALAFGVVPLGCLIAWLAARSGPAACTQGSRVGAAMGRLVGQAGWLWGALALADAFARPRRALFTLVLVAGGTFAVTAVVMAGATLQRFAADPPSWGLMHRAAVWVADAHWAHMPFEDWDHSSGIGLLPPETVVEQWEQAVLTASGERFALRAVGGAWQTLDWRLRRGEPPRGPGQIVLGTLLAKRLGMRPGQSFDMEVQGRFVRVEIVGEQFTVESGGDVGIVTLDTLTQNGIALRPSRLLYAGEQVSAWVEALERVTGGSMPIELEPTTTPAFVRDLGRIAFAMAAILAATGLLGVGAASLLLASERAAEAALLKALGLQPTGVWIIGPLGAALLGGVGGVIGVLGGLVGTSALFAAVGEWVGFGAIPITWSAVQVATIVCAVPVLCALAALPGVGRERLSLTLSRYN